MYTEAIHASKTMRGLGITDMHNIDAEHKVSVFCQWLFSNDTKLRNSSVANLQVEWHKQKLIMDVDNVFNSVSTYTSKRARKQYTLWENIRKHLYKYRVEVRVTYNKSLCFCAMPDRYKDDLFCCISCCNTFYVSCDKKGVVSGVCVMCRDGKHLVKHLTKKAYTNTYFQDNCYN
jgi:hypothetical protein